MWNKHDDDVLIQWEEFKQRVRATKLKYIQFPNGTRKMRFYKEVNRKPHLLTLSYGSLIETFGSLDEGFEAYFGEGELFQKWLDSLPKKEYASKKRLTLTFEEGRLKTLEDFENYVKPNGTCIDCVSYDPNRKTIRIKTCMKLDDEWLVERVSYSIMKKVIEEQKMIEVQPMYDERTGEQILNGYDAVASMIMTAQDQEQMMLTEREVISKEKAEAKRIRTNARRRQQRAEARAKKVQENSE